MSDKDYKQYHENRRRGIKGEAFFESLIVDHAIPHRIAQENDLGVDFLCEWTCGDHPTGLLFSAQVKTTTSATVECEKVGQSPLNCLDEYVLHGARKIEERTINYWKGLGLPAYLFVVVEDESNLECYHKRYTPLLDGRSDADDRSGTKRFYHVNNGATFRAFADVENEIGGFARDLIIDYAKLSYSKGHIVELTPRQLGFWPFPNNANPDVIHYFDEMVGWHREKIKATCDWTNALLARLPVE